MKYTLAVIFIDFFKAFDMIDNANLLIKFKQWEVNGNLPRSYLNRNQRADINLSNFVIQHPHSLLQAQVYLKFNPWLFAVPNTTKL